MNLPWFHKSDRADVAAMRDRLIAAETKAALLEDIVLHPPVPRRLREPRKDASFIKAENSVMTLRLLSELGRLSADRTHP